MIFIKYPFVQVYFLKTWADGYFYFIKRMCILVKRLLSYGNEVFYTIIRTRYPRGKAFWHLVLIFNLYRLPILGDILYFLRCHRFAPRSFSHCSSEPVCRFV